MVGLAWSRPEVPRRVATRPVGIEFLDGSQRVAALAGLDPTGGQAAATTQLAGRLATTPSERSPRTLQVMLERGPAAVPTAEIRRILIQPVERIVIRSDATVTALDLGDAPNKRPEPAGWYQPDAVIQGWEPAALQSPYYRWRYIPEACWIWAKRPGRARQGEVVLFRQEFSLPTTATLVAAHLDISADDQIESFFINGVPVQLPAQSLLGKVLHWDVTYLLRPGRNLIAARVANLASHEQLNYAGVCYRIACDVRTKPRAPKPIAPAVRLFFANGDRLSGELAAVTSRQWRMRCGGKTVEVDTDWVTLALMNYSELPAAGRDRRDSKSLLGPLAGLLGTRGSRSAVTLAPRLAVAWNESIEPAATERGLLNRNGEWVEGRIESLNANHIQIKPRYGETVGFSVDRVALLQPNRPDPATQFFFHPADFPAVVRVWLANNDQLTGALESLTPYSVTVTPHFAAPIRLDLDEVLAIDFPMNTQARSRARIARAWPAQTPLQVATIGEAESGVGPAKDPTVQAIHRALLNLGLEMRWLDAYQVAAPASLTPDRFPILINLDQNERYFYSVREKADGFEALRRYVNEGGTLIHLARGVPFSQGYFPDRGRWNIQRTPQNLNAQLMMDILTPDRQSAEGRPFQLPPNRGQHMLFVLERQSSALTDGLPPEVELPMISDMRFRPITDDRTTTPSRFIPIYRLVDTAGVNYGIAMAAVRYGPDERPHYGVYVSHLLYGATFEGTPMIDYLLPKLIEMALGAGPVPVANLASGNNADTKSPAQAARLEPAASPPIPSPR